MIIFVIIALILIAQIIYKIVRRDQINQQNFYFDQEMSKLSIIPNIKKKNILIMFVSIVLSLICLSLPIALNVSLHMQFPKEMFIGKLNFLFTFVLAYSCFILMNIINHKILKSYIYEYQLKNPDVNEDVLPKIDLKMIFINDLTNVFITIFVLVLIVALYVFI